jgi:DNA repair photolyase
MSPVLPPSASVRESRRRPATLPPVRLLPFCPESPDPQPEAAAPSRGENGGCKGSVDLPPADCPPPQLHTPRAPLAGIARLAANSLAAETRRSSQHKPEYFVLPVKSILNRCDSNRVPFDWTINPYRGCEFGCKYCYARYTHEYMQIDGGEFERKIFVKKDASVLLARDIAEKYSYESAASGGMAPEHIAIGTATDPYQPAETEYGVTRACLEALAKREGLRVSIVTKSNQVARDIDVLKAIAAKSALTVSITVTTLRTRLARILEPRAPRPDLRMAAVKQLSDAGLHVGVSASPMLPGINEAELERIAEAAKDAGARWLYSEVLFLMPSSAKQFLPFIREKFPKLVKQYEQWYTKNGYAPEEYRKRFNRRVEAVRQKLGFARREWEEMRAVPVGPRQMRLGWDAGAISAARIAV